MYAASKVKEHEPYLWP